MGEPLHNLEAVLSAVDILVDEAGFAFSRNKVTVSTSGLVPPLRRFLAESPACLAVSLNATTEAVRSWIMVRRSIAVCTAATASDARMAAPQPVNRKHSLAELLAVLRESFPRRGAGRVQAKVFFEYVLLRDVNDTDDDLARLIDIARSLPCKVNLLTWNAHEGASPLFAPSPRERLLAFRDELATAGITATIRCARQRADTDCYRQHPC